MSTTLLTVLARALFFVLGAAPWSVTGGASGAVFAYVATGRSRLLLGGFGGLTLGRAILFAEIPTPPLVRHELKHVAQFVELGALRFGWRYLVAYVRGRRAGLSHLDAYMAIPLEVEARAAE